MDENDLLKLALGALETGPTKRYEITVKCQLDLTVSQVELIRVRMASVKDATVTITEVPN